MTTTESDDEKLAQIARRHLEPRQHSNRQRNHRRSRRVRLFDLPGFYGLDWFHAERVPVEVWFLRRAEKRR